MKKNIAIFASGNGSNFVALVKAVKQRRLDCRISLLVCDNPHAPVLEKARKAGIETLLVERPAFASRRAFEEAVIRYLKAADIKLIVLAGFMRVLSPLLVNAFRGKIINIHPALLPAFKGAHAIADAFHYGVKITGVTVHVVDEEVDHGPIILQEAVPIKPADTLASLEKRIHQVEHRLYPRAVRLCLEGKVKVAGRTLKPRS
ncbi:MAG TPA: phosphoribosylglycinamide formyltransferase [Candidatus Omnitrophota bacterium]|nr:phosphoribosylglycinamide formyltransferase [Candidatus Omnitrophota bacterium]